MATSNILQYESKIWATADLLRGCGIKESEWPSYMMPFFALVMIESRLVRMFDELKAEIGAATLAEISPADLTALIDDKGQGYNVYIFEKNQTLKDICQNDKSFDVDFEAYLRGFDGETRDLLGVVVHNGSTLFSGDAGSAESNIRKWMLDIDIVEAVIQLPTDEFFNTGIYTYLWVLNKRKSGDRKDQVMLINASEKFKPLKKNKGSKRKEIDEASRLEIVETLAQFVDNDYGRVFEKEFFYFNKQGIMLTNVDEQGRSFASHLKEGKTSLKLSPIELDNGARSLTEFTISDSPQPPLKRWENMDLLTFYEQDIKPFIDSLDYKDQPLVVVTDGASYSFDADRETIIKQSGAKREELGCGKIVVKAAFKKASKTQAERIEITVELTPDYQKDYEIIPFHRDEVANREAIEAFMAKYITKPFEYLENVVGVEINFNKVFYKPEKLRSVEEILGEILLLDQELGSLEQGLSL